MRFGLLGPLLVHDGETLVRVPKGRQRALLAVLLMRAGTPVPLGALAEVVWEEEPPSGAAVTLRSHVLRLRRVLGPRAGARVVTRYPGYLLQATEDEVDLLRFRSLCRDGAAAMRMDAWSQADELLGEALALWRGTPFADIPCAVLQRDEAPALAELRLQAKEWRIDAGLRLGRHAESITELRQLTAAHPMREHLHGLLMLALYRDGRQAEALAAYQLARRIVVDELGTEPGSILQDLHQRMLKSDPALGIPLSSSAAITGNAKPTVPRELPTWARNFIGRSDELRALTKFLDKPSETLVISTIEGTAGVGKTALAVYWAHQVVERFPDGQLYVNLRGCDRCKPMSAADALARFLRSLGVPGQHVPADEDERAARYRSILAGKRMLVILDNARSVEQVRPLLPGSASCAVLVTSRDTLAGLVAQDGAMRVELGRLSLDDAVGLLRLLIGGRVDADPDAAAQLAVQCRKLPLALRMAGELAASLPHVPLAALVAELKVPDSMSWSCRHPDADIARAFRLLGLHTGLDFGSPAPAALTNGAKFSEAAAKITGGQDELLAFYGYPAALSRVKMTGGHRFFGPNRTVGRLSLAA